MQTEKWLETQLQTARQLVDIGSQNLRQGNITAASEVMQEASAILDMAEQPEFDEVLKLRARVLNELGVISQRTNQIERARDLHREAARMCDMLLEQGHEFRGNSAATHLNLSSILAALGELEEARKVSERALELIESLRAEEQAGVDNLAMGAYLNMGLICARSNDLAASDDYMNRALTIADQLAEKGQAEITVQAAQGCQQLSVGMFEAQKFEEALKWGEKAAEYSERAYEALGQQVLGIYVVSQINLISYHERLGNFADAEDSLFKALDVVGNDAQILRRGLAFYEQLRKQADSRLEAGNLPREEVEDSYNEIKSRIEAIGGLPPLQPQS